jgi:hypothetical protein
MDGWMDGLISWKMVASRRMLDMAGVQYRQHHVSKPTVVIDFSAIA